VSPYHTTSLTHTYIFEGGITFWHPPEMLPFLFIALNTQKVPIPPVDATEVRSADSCALHV